MPSAWSIAVLLVAMIGIALLHVRRIGSQALEEQKRLVSLFDTMLKGASPVYEIVDWDTTLVIDERGDTQERLHVRARAVSGEVRFMRLVFGCGWGQPARFRRRVQLSVRSMLVDGTPGTSLSPAITWPRSGWMAAVIQFREPLAQGKDVTLAIDVSWPRQCAPLIEGVPDEYRVKFFQPVQHVRYRIVLPPGASAFSELIGSEKFPDRYQLVVTRTYDDRQLVIFETFDLPPRHRVGVRLELRDGINASAIGPAGQ